MPTRSILLMVMLALAGQASIAFAQDKAPPTTGPATLPAGQSGWLGCKLRENEDWAGVVIDEVLDGTPAAAAGFKAKDVVMKIDGDTIADLQAFVDKMRQTHPGQQVKFTVVRDKDEKEIPVTLGERPKNI